MSGTLVPEQLRLQIGECSISAKTPWENIKETHARGYKGEERFAAPYAPRINWLASTMRKAHLQCPQKPPVNAVAAGKSREYGSWTRKTSTRGCCSHCCNGVHVITAALQIAPH
eukprot:1157906-Pelagomonas_calceolata.AAC.7